MSAYRTADQEKTDFVARWKRGIAACLLIAAHIAKVAKVAKIAAYASATICLLAVAYRLMIAAYGLQTRHAEQSARARLLEAQGPCTDESHRDSETLKCSHVRHLSEYDAVRNALHCKCATSVSTILPNLEATR